MTAGLYASRAKLDTILLDSVGCGGQSVITDWIDNYPGFPEGSSGYDLAANMEKQARRFNLAVVLEEATSIERQPDGFTVSTPANTYHTKTVIIAAGATHKKMDVPGELDLTGKGVSYCATCDGPFFRDKEVALVGGGDSAIQEAIFLTRFVKSVTVIHRRDSLRAAKILQDKAFANPKIKFIWDSVVTAVRGNDQATAVALKNVRTDAVSELPVSGIFVFIGLVPNTAFLSGLVACDKQGYIVTDDAMATAIPGIFACGDIRVKLLRQVVTAAGDGATAAVAAQHYLESLS
ncbi:MAG: thioredoxin-disulfide reductase [Elusimicrobia bacterium]|nr:thioredoxin-disulfide reductase [Elusimicrobiota bacterium]